MSLSLSPGGKGPGTEGKSEDSCLEFWPVAGLRGQRSKGDFLRLPGECQLSSQPGCCASPGWTGRAGWQAEGPAWLGLLSHPVRPWGWSGALAPAGPQPVPQGRCAPVPPGRPYPEGFLAAAASLPHNHHIREPEKPFHRSLFDSSPIPRGSEGFPWEEPWQGAQGACEAQGKAGEKAAEELPRRQAPGPGQRCFTALA